MNKPKTNPRRRPATQADVEAARVDGIEKGLLLCIWTLIDKGIIQPTQIQALAAGVDSTADSISQGYVKWRDIERTLAEEYKIEVRMR